MFVHGNFSGIPTIGSYHTERFSQVTAKQSVGRVGLRPSKDILFISPSGKAHSAISGLEKLKQQIEDRRSEFLSKATEEGQSVDMIQARLDSFDQQLKDIDQQIAQMSIQRMSQTIEQQKYTSSISIRRAQTRQEAENARLADITNMSTGMEQAQAVHSVKTRVDGDVRIKKSEIELEKGRGGDTTQMEAELSELENQSDQLTVGIHAQLQEIQEELDQSVSIEIEDSKKADEEDSKNGSNIAKTDSLGEAESKKDVFQSVSSYADQK